MSPRPFTLATGTYDTLQPLVQGRIRPEGLALTHLTVPCAARHRRMLRDGAYDAAEFSMGSFLVARARGLDALVGLPFFTRRMFPHRFLFVRAGDTLHRPEDLAGRRVGILSWQNSLAIFAKAALTDGALSTIRWVTTAHERLPIDLPAGAQVEHRPGCTLETLLERGEVDAIATPDIPDAALGPAPRLRPLFDDATPAELAWLARTGTFPIMHLVVVRADLVAQAPWVVTSLYDALLASQRAYERGVAQQPQRQLVVWPQHADARERFGGEPFRQGLAQNRHDLKAMIALAAAQGLVEPGLTPEDLFHPSLSAS
ncbi:MAG: hypothetical protein H6739_31535 [Alphaproteobacteria bacterium]|nr:hypothetical protein [Alphaproteobacteria bacterium]